MRRQNLLLKFSIAVLSIHVCQVCWAQKTHPPHTKEFQRQQRRASRDVAGNIAFNAGRGIVPGEFESQERLMFGCRLKSNKEFDFLVHAVTAVHTYVPVTIIAGSGKERKRLVSELEKQHVTDSRIAIKILPQNSTWIRDYGPVIIRDGIGVRTLIDTKYSNGSRPLDDRMPQTIAQIANVPLEKTPLYLEGGNLLSNGQGLYLSTKVMFAWNRQLNGVKMRELLRRTFGAKQVVFLEPLVGEPTGHVDMFATFTDPVTVLVGDYEGLDLRNTAVLDRNVERLRRVRIDGRPLNIRRIPMPRHSRTRWPTFTNVVYANGAVLVPTYGRQHGEQAKRAIAIYKEMLPERDIIPIDSSSIISRGGALHCVSLNVPVSKLVDNK